MSKYMFICMSFFKAVDWCIRREGKRMSKTARVRKNESLEDALRRFKRSVSKTGTFAGSNVSVNFMKNLA